LKGYAPFSTLFSLKLLNLVKGATMQTDLEVSDNELIRELHSKDLCVENTEKDPLDKALDFQQLKMSDPRLTRFIPVEVYYSQSAPIPDGTRMDYAFSTVPAFSMTATKFDEEVWLAAEEFQDANPTTFISRVQIIYAIMVFMYMNQGNRVANPPNPTGGQTPDSEMGLEVFVAYFPAYLRLHEIYRLGAYIDPFYMIRSLYAREATIPSFRVDAPDLDSKWAKVTKNEGLQNGVQNPFASLTPAMMEGSALGGPYLQFGSISLSTIHQLMGLGSIWTIGLLEPVSAKQSAFGLFAFPA